MKRFFTLGQISIFASIFLSSCLGSKYLKPDEQLLVKYEVHGLSGARKDDAEGLVLQSPNSKVSLMGITIIPFTHLAHTYQLGKNGFLFFDGYNEEKTIQERDDVEAKFERKIANASKEEKQRKLRQRMIKKLDKKDRKLKEGNQLMRWGEELAVYHEDQSQQSAEKVKLYLNSKGFFNSDVTVDKKIVNQRKRKVSVEYKVKPGSRYRVDSIEYVIADTALARIVSENLKQAPLKKGFYNQQTLSQERDHIYNLAVNNGYFEFSKQFVSFEIDSVKLKGQKLYVRETIGNPAKRPKHKVFTLDSVIFTSDASITQAFERSIETHDDVTFNFGKNRYSKKILHWRIPLEKGDVYSRNLTIETQRQLSYLDNFKFVNINYDTTGNRFVANIFTSPFDRYQTSNEFGFTQTNGARPGPFFTVNLKNRNAFKGLEIISIDVNAKLEGIRNVSEDDEKYSSRQYGGQLSFSFPQFLFPLGSSLKKQMGSYNAKSRFSVGLSYEQRIDEYVRRTIQTSFSYSWQVRDKIKYTLTPLQGSLIRSDNEDTFEEFLTGLESQGNTYANAFRSAFVSSTSFQIDLNLGNYAQGRDGGFVRFFTEAGGNLNGFIGERAVGDDIQIYRFVKTNIDLRKIDRISRRLNLAYRFNIGLAYAYGSNNSLPYEKYFFGGGSNSLRAWKPRRLGPGAFGQVDSLGTAESNGRVINFAREQPGDLIIESSFELRHKLVGFLEAAVFLDAGNVWLIKGSSVQPELDPEGDDGKFRINEFMNEMAVGTGLGFRFDLSFLIMRLDLGLKLFDPAQPKGGRFVGDKIFSNFGPNSEFNIGIGYPF
ncbi:MAG: BamA/TamA family outer membrane protein [Cyclobacteriaceae bacterium]